MVYKYIANTDTTTHGQKMMNTQIKLDLVEVKEFFGDFDKLFENLVKSYIKDAEQLKTCKEYFLKKYPKIFRDFQKMKLKWTLTLTPQWRLNLP